MYASAGTTVVARIMGNGPRVKEESMDTEQERDQATEVDPTQDPTTQEAQEDAAAREPGSDEDKAAEGATSGDQGPWEQGLQDAAPANATESGFNPDRPVRTSPPAPEEQSGVPNLPEGRNEGVEPQPEHAGTVAPASAPEGDQDTADEDDPDEV